MTRLLEFTELLVWFTDQITRVLMRLSEFTELLIMFTTYCVGGLSRSPLLCYDIRWDLPRGDF